jgi:hypothetical protein
METAVGVGVVLALAVGVLGTVVGFDRGRTYYAVMAIVVASYYGLFAVLGGSTASLWADGAVAAAFAVLAVAGYRSSLWLVVVALAGHGAMDAVHHLLIDNAGVPPWWPGFCAAFDVVAALYLAVLLVRRGEPRELAAGARLP